MGSPAAARAILLPSTWLLFAASLDAAFALLVPVPLVFACLFLVPLEFLRKFDI
jgi:hypothetical protein